MYFITAVFDVKYHIRVQPQVTVCTLHYYMETFSKDECGTEVQVYSKLYIFSIHFCKPRLNTNLEKHISPST